MLAETETVPACNQIEVHPYLRQDEVRMFDAAHGIANEAWAPIAQGAVLDDPRSSTSPTGAGAPPPR